MAYREMDAASKWLHDDFFTIPAPGQEGAMEQPARAEPSRAVAASKLAELAELAELNVKAAR